METNSESKYSPYRQSRKAGLKLHSLKRDFKYTETLAVRIPSYSVSKKLDEGSPGGSAV